MPGAPLSASALLDVWDAGQGRAPAEQALLLLAAAHADVEPAALAALSLGRRNVLLLELRRALLGEALACRAACPQCGAALEFTVSVGNLLAPDAPIDQPAIFELRSGALTATMRLPNSDDVLAAGRCADAETAHQLLIARCVAQTHVAGDPLDLDALPADVIAALAAAAAARDPMAELLLEMICPDCAAGWQAPLDIAGFMWQELDVAAQRLWHEVHLLARAYGWHESEILALSARRRGRYLALIENG